MTSGTIVAAKAATKDRLVKIWFEFIAISFFYFFYKRTALPQKLSYQKYDSGQTVLLGRRSSLARSASSTNLSYFLLKKATRRESETPLNNAPR
jgi:hypothetical protein